MIQYLNVFFSRYLPVLVWLGFILGSWLRYDYGHVHLARRLQPDAG